MEPPPFSSLSCLQRKIAGEQTPFMKSISVCVECAYCHGRKWSAYGREQFVRMATFSFRLVSVVFTCTHRRQMALVWPYPKWQGINNQQERHFIFPFKSHSLPWRQFSRKLARAQRNIMEAEFRQVPTCGAI
jgi:hypothetical protein